jgi:hypothetical protein
MMVPIRDGLKELVFEPRWYSGIFGFHDQKTSIGVPMTSSTGTNPRYLLVEAVIAVVSHCEQVIAGDRVTIGFQAVNKDPASDHCGRVAFALDKNIPRIKILLFEEPRHSLLRRPIQSC